MRTRMSRDDDGFTLVELLTVIVILGVLATIALPNLLGQKDKAFRAAMKSDLRSVVIAQAALGSDGVGPTEDVDVLREHGYATTDGVSLPHVVATGASFVACVTHDAVGEWLVYDAATSSFTTAGDDCADA